MKQCIKFLHTYRDKNKQQRLASALSAANASATAAVAMLRRGLTMSNNVWYHAANASAVSD